MAGISLRRGHRARRARNVAANALAGAVVAACVLALGAGDSAAAVVSPGQAPFGEKISEERIPQYHRATPVIGTAGNLAGTGIQEARRLGFRTILDLGTGRERIDHHRGMADFSHLRYLNLPVTEDLPTAEQLAEFTRVVDDPANQPVLVYGDDIERVAAMWAFYRARQGVPPEIALLDGLTAGLGARADAVRAGLGLPPADDQPTPAAGPDR